jgi:hypothetical protein
MAELSKLPKEAKRGRIRWTVNCTRILSVHKIETHSELFTKNRGSIRHHLLEEKRREER